MRPVLFVVALLVGCSKPASEATPTPAPAPAKPAVVAWSARISRPAAERLVAIGDLHGDLDVTRRVFRLAGAIDDKDTWVGGKLVVVQTGDAIDRGDDDRPILDLLEKWKGQAKDAGGELIALSGNHELMNAQQDFRYVTPAAAAAFDDVGSRGRAFAPGSGPYAKMIADRPVFVKVGDSVFVHGGILPKHVRYGLDRMNDEVHDWLLGSRSEPPKIIMQEDAPVWSRMYSAAPAREDCAVLEETLAAVGAKRMVMGHTVQRNGVNPACDSQAWRIDTGLSKYYGGKLEALEIKGDLVRVLR